MGFVRKHVALEASADAALRQQRVAQEFTKAKMREAKTVHKHPSNCPNCGALWEPVCSYCGRDH